MPKSVYPRIKVGQTFDRLVVIGKGEKDRWGGSTWLCRCSCGKERNVRGQHLNTGATKSCGCLSKDITVGKAKEKAGEILGRKINQWTVIELLPRRAKNGGVYFLCRCECGAEREVAGDGLLAGRSKSCGGCGIHQKPTCKFGHIVADWGGRTPSGACKACVKHKSLIRNYGISLSEYLALWEYQEGKCAVCKRTLEKGIGVPGFGSHTEKLGRPEIDHEHGHKEVSKSSVRGILCGGRWAGCNRKLGRIDNLEWLLSVVSYLQHPPAKAFFKEPKEEVKRGK